MANWNKQYKAASTKGDITRALGFATLETLESDNLNRELTNDLEKLVDEQIALERRNTEVQREKGCLVGMLLGAAATYAGLFIGIITNAYRNKK